MVLAIIVLVQLQLTLVMFAPAAVASPIISDLQVTRTEFGLIMSALNIAIAVSQALGSVLVDRAGLKLGLFSGLALVGIGAALLLGVHSLQNRPVGEF
jgi:sugar phosphate permease